MADDVMDPFSVALRWKHWAHIGVVRKSILGHIFPTLLLSVDPKVASKTYFQIYFQYEYRQNFS